MLRLLDVAAPSIGDRFVDILDELMIIPFIIGLICGIAAVVAYNYFKNKNKNKKSNK